MTPLTVLPRTERDPRNQHASLFLTDITPLIETLYDYYPLSQGSEAQLTVFSVWASPWWVSTDQSDRIHGAFSSAFSNAFSKPESP